MKGGLTLKRSNWESLGVLLLFLFLIRLYPVSAGYMPHESDTYLWLRCSDYLRDHGPASWGSWFDTLRWGGGVDQSAEVNAAMPYTLYALSLVFGSTLDAARYGPPIFAAFQALGVYCTARAFRLRGRTPLYAAAASSFALFYYVRSVAGWMDTDIVGLTCLAWCPGMLYYAMRDDARRFRIVAAASALVFCFCFVAWKGALLCLAPLGLILLDSALRGKVEKTVYSLGCYSLSMLGVILFTEVPGRGFMGVFTKAGRFIADGAGALNIAEQARTDPLVFMVVTPLLAFAAIGLAAGRDRRRGLILGAWLLASCAAALSAIRLNVYTAFPVGLLAAMGLSAIESNFERMSEPLCRVGAPLAFMVLAASAAPGLLSTVQQPVVMVADGGEWPRALDWVRGHPGTYAAWWDYGYWVQYAGGATICDGQTNHGDRIRDTALILTGSSGESRELCVGYGVDYVVVTQHTRDVNATIRSVSGSSGLGVLNAPYPWMTLVYETSKIQVYRVN